MRTDFATTTIVAFAMIIFSTGAKSFVPEFTSHFVEALPENDEIAPIVEPAFIPSSYSPTFSLRGSLPYSVDQQHRIALPHSLHVLPLSRPVQLASLSMIDPMILPLPSDRDYRKMVIPPSSDQLPSSKHFRVRRSTLAPMAFVKYCSRNKNRCKAGEAEEIKLSNTVFSTLEKINHQVNRSIRPRNERKDVWQDNVTVGDCEDYALTKRAKLMDLGFSASALRIAVATTPSGIGHAVLVVSTDRGDFVMDNRNGELKAFDHTDLTWLKIQGQKNPLFWHEV